MIAKVSALAKVGLSVAAGLLGLTVLMTVLAAAGSEAAREGESLAAYSELLSSVATLTVTAYPTNIRVDGDTSAITATLWDESGKPATDETGIDVTFFTTLGILDSDTDTVTKTAKTGVVTAELTSQTQGGTATISVTADSASDWIHVTFSYRTPAAVTVGANPTSIFADGVSTSTITAMVKDELGFPIVDGTVVTFTTSLGVISPATDTTSDGEALTTLTSDSTVGTARVTATADSKAGNALVTFVTFVTRIFLPLVMKSYTP